VKKILLVDDNELNITILLNALGGQYDVSVALSAKEAFEGALLRSKIKRLING